MSSYTVIYDACVLYPAPLRDLLLQLATAELFRAKWTDAIHDEWMRNLRRRRPQISAEKLERTRALMNASVMDCLVEGYEYLIDALELPDKDDRHVLAAAIHARCDAIITLNIRDFPREYLSRFNIEAAHPDDFIYYQFDLDHAAVRACRLRLKKPEISAGEYLDILERHSLTKTVGELRRYGSII